MIINVPIMKKVIKFAIVTIIGNHWHQRHIKFVEYPSLKVSPYTDEIIGDHQCRFQCNSSTTDQIFCIRQILEKEKWEYNETVHQLIIDFKKAYDTDSREVLYNCVLYSWN
jgi:hypothetical protein